MPSSHLILCRPLLLLPPIPPSIRVFPTSQLFAWGGQSTGVSALASFLPKKSQGWSPSNWIGCISLQSKGLSRVFSNTTVQKHQFFSAQPASQSNSHIHWRHKLEIISGSLLSFILHMQVGSKTFGLYLQNLSRTKSFHHDNLGQKCHHFSLPVSLKMKFRVLTMTRRSYTIWSSLTFPILFIMILCFAYSGTVPFHKKAHIQKRTSDLELNALQPHFENVNILSLNMCFINKVQ